MYINFESNHISKLECEAMIAFLQVMKQGASDEIVRDTTCAPVVAENVVTDQPGPSSTACDDQHVPSAEDESDDDDTPNDNPPELDAAGFPWDERIHASTKTTNKDGTWKLRRNVDKDLVEQIKAEFTGQQQTAPAVEQQQQPDPSTVGFGNQQQQTAPAVEQQQQPQTDVTWVQVLQRISKAQQEGKIDQSNIDTAVQQVGVGSLPLLASRPDLFGPFLTTLGV